MRLRSIQVLRAVAATSVLLLHATRNGGPAFSVGAAGVDLFFVISGFIMAKVAGGRCALDFLSQRLWRIYPIWWLAVLARLCFVGHSDLTASRLLASITLWPVWGEYVVPVPPLGWTLSFEMLFYLGVTLAIVVRPAFPLALFGACLFASLHSNAPIFDFLGNPMIFEFLFGFCIARLPLRPRLGLPLIVLGVAGLVCTPLHVENARLIAMDPQLAPVRVLFWGLPCALILYGAVALEGSFETRRWNALVLLGDASYSIYLFHLIPIANSSLSWWLNAIAALLFGLVAFFSLERPLLRLRRSNQATSGSYHSDPTTMPALGRKLPLA